MSLLQQQSLVQKLKLFVRHTMVSIKIIINKQTYQKIHFPGKTPICKDQQID